MFGQCIIFLVEGGKSTVCCENNVLLLMGKAVLLVACETQNMPSFSTVS